jgi:hypothetical protein
MNSACVLADAPTMLALVVPPAAAIALSVVVPFATS